VLMLSSQTPNWGNWGVFWRVGEKRCQPPTSPVSFFVKKKLTLLTLQPLLTKIRDDKCLEKYWTNI
jgi:hypothetical protein